MSSIVAGRLEEAVVGSPRHALLGGHVEVLVGDAALVRLDDANFLRSWEALQSRCPWATPFQAPAFVRAWYRTYRDRFSPVVVLRQRNSESLSGFLCLAQERRSGQLVHAGADDAEYQAWLADDRDDVPPFVSLAIPALAQAGFTGTLRLLFLAPGTPCDGAVFGRAGLRYSLQWHRRGLMFVGEGSGVPDSLRKRSNRSKLSRLQRLGPVSLETLGTEQELEKVLGEIAVQCDFRKGALHGVLPFRSEPRKAEFLRSLHRHHGLLHACVLRVGETVAAAHIGVRNGDQLTLGLITHAPQLGMHSPGKILLLLLADALRKEGIRWLDLTPIGAYKERFATHHDQVAVLELHLTQRAWLHESLRSAATGLAKVLFHAGGGADLRSATERLKRLRRQLSHPGDLAATVVGAARRRLSRSAQLQLWERAASEVPVDRTEGKVRAQSLEDLLRYHPDSTAAPTQADFLRACLSRMEQGGIAFTAVRGETLVHCSWLFPSTSTIPHGDAREVQLDAPRAVLLDDFTDAAGSAEGLETESMRARLAHASQLGIARVLVAVAPDGHAARERLRTLGFTYRGSIPARHGPGPHRSAARCDTPSPAVNLNAMTPFPKCAGND